MSYLNTISIDETRHTTRPNVEEEAVFICFLRSVILSSAQHKHLHIDTAYEELPQVNEKSTRKVSGC